MILISHIKIKNIVVFILNYLIADIDYAISDMRLVDVAYGIMHAEVMKVKLDILLLGYKMVENLHIYMCYSLLVLWKSIDVTKASRSNCSVVMRNDLWEISESCA